MSAQGAAPLGGTRGQRQIDGNTDSLSHETTAGKARPAAKIERVLAALIAGPKTTRELEQAPVFDHVGHSTAADLRRLGVQIEAERVEIRGYSGEKCWIAKYSIRKEGFAAACALLQTMRERRHGHA